LSPRYQVANGGKVRGTVTILAISQQNIALSLLCGRMTVIGETSKVTRRYKPEPVSGFIKLSLSHKIQQPAPSEKLLYI